MDWYHDLPPVTRALLTLYLATGLAAWLQILPLHYFFHSWQLIFRRVPQVWRLLANFAFLGRPSLPWLFQLVWLVQYGGSYERAKFMGYTPDAVTCLGVGMITGMSLDLFSHLARGLLPPVFSGFFHAGSIVFMLLYLWSRQNPDAPVSLFGVVKLSGRHLPFAFVALDLVMGADVWAGVMGILMGHTYWFLSEPYAQATGRQVIVTPRWVTHLCLLLGFGRVAVPQAGLAHPSDLRFRAFQGRGRRLAD